MAIILAMVSLSESSHAQRDARTRRVVVLNTNKTQIVRRRPPVRRVVLNERVPRRTYVGFTRVYTRETPVLRRVRTCRTVQRPRTEVRRTRVLLRRR